MKRALILSSVLFLAHPGTATTQQLLWSYPCSFGVYASDDLGDVNGDSIPDIVCGKYYSNTGSELFALSGADGGLIWEANDCLGLWGTHGLASVPDLDGDGRREVLMGTPGGVGEGRSVFLKSGASGATLFQYSTYDGPNNGWVYAVSQTGDADGNDTTDLLAAAGGNSTNPSGTVFCFDGGSRTGSVRILWTFSVPGDGAQCVCPMDDVNGDSVPDVAAGAGGNGTDDRVFGLNGATGAQLWQFDTGNSVSDVVDIGDVDGDGIHDLAAGGWDDSVYCLKGNSGGLIWKAGIGDIVMDLERLPDSDGDGRDEVVVGSWSDYLYCLSGADGSVLRSALVASDVWSVDAVDDLDHDGQWEMAGGGLGGGSGRAAAWAVSGSGGALWQQDFTERVYDIQTVGDATGDGVGEVCVCLQDQGHMSDHVLLYDVAHQVGVSGRPEGTATVPSGGRLCLWPNPCRDRVSLSCPAGWRRAEMAIYDLSGRRVMTAGAVKGWTAGASVELSTAGLASGVYLVRLDGGAASAWGRLVVSR